MRNFDEEIHHLQETINKIEQEKAEYEASKKKNFVVDQSANLMTEGINKLREGFSLVLDKESMEKLENYVLNETLIEMLFQVANFSSILDLFGSAEEKENSSFVGDKESATDIINNFLKCLED